MNHPSSLSARLEGGNAAGKREQIGEDQLRGLSEFFHLLLGEWVGVMSCPIADDPEIVEYLDEGAREFPVLAHAFNPLVQSAAFCLGDCAEGHIQGLAVHAAGRLVRFDVSSSLSAKEWTADLLRQMLGDVWHFRCREEIDDLPLVEDRVRVVLRELGDWSIDPINRAQQSACRIVTATASQRHSSNSLVSLKGVGGNYVKRRSVRAAMGAFVIELTHVTCAPGFGLAADARKGEAA